MSFWRIAYDTLALPLARLGVRIAGRFRPKIARGLEGRKQSFRRIDDFLQQSPARRGGILFHVTSVGEFLQALPVMARIRESDCAPPLYLSFFSPSVEKRALSCEHADLAFYLPEDTRTGMRRLLGMLEPRLVVISKFDIWPNLVHLAHERGIPSAVIAATLSPNSGRLRPVVRSFHRSFYRRLDLVCAISDPDGRNFERLGVPPGNITVTGDTRFDQTWERAAGVRDSDPLLVPFSAWNEEHTVFACGSTWPEDEQRVLPALAALCDRHPSLRLIVAPHEPDSVHVEAERRFLQERGIACELYSSLSGSDPRPAAAGTRAIVVDTVGALAAVYRAADIAFVGGSFGRAVHNVMEPACFGLPVLFGPRHLNSYEAILMIERGGAFPVDEAQDIERLADRFIEHNDELRRAGEAARAVVRDNLGATERTLDALRGRYGKIIPGQRGENERPENGKKRA